MNSRKLYGTNKLVDEITKKFIQIEVLDGGWTSKFLNPATGEKWVKYYTDAERGYNYNLIKLEPQPTTEELIYIALQSDYPDEVIAACRRLLYEEKYYQKTFREALIDKLEEKIKGNINLSEKQRIKNILTSATLSDSINRNEIVGKHYTKIFEEYDLIKKLADRSEKILKMLK